jgi:hypothetical protein
MSTDPFSYNPQAAEPSRYKVSQSLGRHALGLPAGSVRALLSLMILGLVWALMFAKEPVPNYLQYLMFMVLGHYFAAHQRSIASVDSREPSPLYMPRGVIRLIIFLGFVVVFGAIWYQHRDNMNKFLEDLRDNPKMTERFLPFLLVFGFFLGLLMTKFGQMFGGKDGAPGWMKDIQAWLGLLAMLGLLAATLVHLVINPSIEDEEKRIKIPEVATNILAALVGFYFGARS